MATLTPATAVAPRPRVSRAGRLGDFRRLAQDPTLLAGLALAAAFVALFVVYPLARLLSEAFFRRGSFDLGAWQSVLTKPVYHRVILNTLALGAIAAVSGTAAGFLYAYTLVRARLPRPLAGYLRLMALLPIISPPFALALATILLFGRSGLISRGVFHVENNVYGLSGLAFVQLITFFPVAFLLFEGMLRAIDPALEEAAMNLGASRWRIFWTVTLPLLVPGIAGSLLLLFIESLADLGNPVLIGGDFNVLAVQSWLAIVGQGNFQLGAALSTVLLFPSVAVYVVQRYWVSRRSYVALTGKPTGGSGVGVGPLGRVALVAFCVALALLVTLLYGTVLAGAFIRVWGADYRLTGEHFATVFARSQKAMRDTTLLAALATPVAAALGLVVAYLTVRQRFAGREALDFLAMLGAAVPGTVIGIGYIVAFNKPPLVLTGTAAIIVIVFAVRSLPTGQRAAVAALQQIDPAVEEASTNLGADAQTTFRRVVLPLIRPALLAGMVFSFTRNMTALSAIIFLASPRWKIMTKDILDLMDLGLLGGAVAYTTLLIAIVLAVIGAMTVLVNRWGRVAAVRLTYEQPV
jgi:iron(III) transport system permease protein